MREELTKTRHLLPATGPIQCYLPQRTLFYPCGRRKPRRKTRESLSSSLNPFTSVSKQLPESAAISTPILPFGQSATAPSAGLLSLILWAAAPLIKEIVTVPPFTTHPLLPDPVTPAFPSHFCSLSALTVRIEPNSMVRLLWLILTSNFIKD